MTMTMTAAVLVTLAVAPESAATASAEPTAAFRHVAIVAAPVPAAGQEPFIEAATAQQADPERHLEVDANGNLAMPMPYLASETILTSTADGGLSVSFAVHYDVSIPMGDPGLGRPDESVITLMVASKMGVNGPERLSPEFVKVLVDGQLDQQSITRDYTIALPQRITNFLIERGFDPTLPGTSLGEAGNSGGSGKGDEQPAAAPAISADRLAAQRAALQYVEINVAQVRDFKAVDGVFDWSQSRAWTAADGPVTESITDSSTFTVVNNTDQIGLTLGDPGDNDFSALGGTDSSLGVPIVLAGQPVECIGQGNGSNPTGFQLTNGFDVVDDLPPGQLPVGASITQQVNADDSLGAQTLGGSQDLVTGTTQVLAASASVTTPGLKSALTGFALLAADATGFGTIATVVLAIPFKAIGQLVRTIVNSATDSCADYSNIFNLTAAEPSGATASYSWADQTNGLFDTYAAATYGTAPVITNNVGVSQSIGVAGVNITTATKVGLAAVNPWLTQVAETGCGSSAHGLVNNTGSCGSSGNNVVGVTWSANNPCPQDQFAMCQPQEQDLSTFPPVSVPGSDLCGASNELCPTLAAPIADGSDISTPFYLAGSEDDAFTVLRQWNPPSDTVNAMIAGSLSSPGQGPEVYLGWQSGSVTQGSPTAGDSPSDNVLFTLDGAVTSMAVLDSVLYVGDSAGHAYQWITGQSVPTEFTAGVLNSGVVEHMATANNQLYLAIDDQVWIYTPTADELSPFYTGDVQVTSLQATDSQLLIGFDNGVIQWCTLGDLSCPLQENTLASGLPAAVTTMTSSGAVAYAGLADGSVYRADTTSKVVTVLQESGLRDAATAGMAVVDGALYFGGCFGSQNPITGDLLGVYAVPALPPAGENEPFYPVPNQGYNNCGNVSTVDSNYTGFQIDQYAITSAQPQPGFPSIVYVAFTISGNDGNFFYALQNNQPPTSNLCYASAGPCPDYANTAPQPNTAPVPAPVGGLGALGTPASVSSCDGDVSVAAAPGPDTASGLQISVPTADNVRCTTTIAWSLNNVGSLPYGWWSGNIYGTSASNGTTMTVTAGDGPPPFDNSAQWSADLQTTPLLGADGALSSTALPAVATISSGELGVVPTTNVTSTGTHVTAPLADPASSAPMLSLQLSVPSGGDGTFTITDDTLGLAGAPAPTPTPLTGQTHCAAALPISPPAGSLIYPLDDAGSAVTDIGGQGWNGIAWNTSSFDVLPGPIAACPNSGALGFDGTTTHVTAPAAASGAASGPAGTVIGWFKAADTQTGNPRIVANDHPDETGTGFQLSMVNSATGITSGMFQIGTTSGLATAAWTASPAAGQWHQYVGTWDGSTITAYLDGQPIGTSAYSGSVVAGTSPIAVGYDPQYSGDYFAGEISNVAVLPVALTADQVAQAFPLGGGA